MPCPWGSEREWKRCKACHPQSPSTRSAASTTRTDAIPLTTTARRHRACLLGRVFRSQDACTRSPSDPRRAESAAARLYAEAISNRLAARRAATAVKRGQAFDEVAALWLADVEPEVTRRRSRSTRARTSRRTSLPSSGRWIAWPRDRVIPARPLRAKKKARKPM